VVATTRAQTMPQSGCRASAPLAIVSAGGALPYKKLRGRFTAVVRR